MERLARVVSATGQGIELYGWKKRGREVNISVSGHGRESDRIVREKDWAALEREFEDWIKYRLYHD